MKLTTTQKATILFTSILCFMLNSPVGRAEEKGAALTLVVTTDLVT